MKKFMTIMKRHNREKNHGFTETCPWYGRVKNLSQRRILSWVLKNGDGWNDKKMPPIVVVANRKIEISFVRKIMDRDKKTTLLEATQIHMPVGNGKPHF